MLPGHNLAKEQVAPERAWSENHKKLSDQQTPIIPVSSWEADREEKGCTYLYRSWEDLYGSVRKGGVQG